MTVSLIIATYNWPRALELCLESVMRQSTMPSEILIADDGSGMSTRNVVERFAAISPFRCATSGTKTADSGLPPFATGPLPPAKATTSSSSTET